MAYNISMTRVDEAEPESMETRHVVKVIIIYIISTPSRLSPVSQTNPIQESFEF